MTEDRAAFERDQVAQTKGMETVPDDVALSLVGDSFPGNEPTEPSGSPTEPEEPEKTGSEGETGSPEDTPDIVVLDMEDGDQGGTEDQTPDEGKNLTDKERARLWQSKADKLKHELEVAQAKIESMQKVMQAVENPEFQKLLQGIESGQVAPPSKEEPSEFAVFAKKPEDYMEAGAVFVPEDALDSSTPSGQAFMKWQIDRDRHLAEQVLSKVQEKNDQRQSEELFNRQVTILRQKRPEYNDEKLQELIQFAFRPADENTLLHLSYLYDLVHGKIPLTKAQMEKLTSLVTPKKNTTTLAKETGTGEETEDEDDKILKQYFGKTLTF